MSAQLPERSSRNANFVEVRETGRRAVLLQ